VHEDGGGSIRVQGRGRFLVYGQVLRPDDTTSGRAALERPGGLHTGNHAIATARSTVAREQHQANRALAVVATTITRATRPAQPARQDASVLEGRRCLRGIRDDARTVSSSADAVVASTEADWRAAALRYTTEPASLVS